MLREFRDAARPRTHAVTLTVGHRASLDVRHVTAVDAMYRTVDLQRLSQANAWANTRHVERPGHAPVRAGSGPRVDKALQYFKLTALSYIDPHLRL